MTHPSNGFGVSLHEAYPGAVAASTSAAAAAAVVLKINHKLHGRAITLTLPEEPQDIARVALLFGTGAVIYFSLAPPLKSLSEKMITKQAAKPFAGWLARFIPWTSAMGATAAIAHLKPREQFIACAGVGIAGTIVWYLTPAAPPKKKPVPTNGKKQITANDTSPSAN